MKGELETSTAHKFYILYVFSSPQYLRQHIPIPSHRHAQSFSNMLYFDAPHPLACPKRSVALSSAPIRSPVPTFYPPPFSYIAMLLLLSCCLLVTTCHPSRRLAPSLTTGCLLRRSRHQSLPQPPVQAQPPSDHLLHCHTGPRYRPTCHHVRHHTCQVAPASLGLRLPQPPVPSVGHPRLTVQPRGRGVRACATREPAPRTPRRGVPPTSATQAGVVAVGGRTRY